MPIRALLAMLSLLFPSFAMAFKVDTHVWIGQEVINDLSSCSMPGASYCIRLSIEGRDVAVPVQPHIAEAILNNQASYRIGHIGPDAFPDVLVGQMNVHPGGEKVEDWGTNNWLMHLLAKAGSQKEVAFVYGFLGHAAADSFAHTYVNSYSGDIFTLSDKETEVEKRHVYLETYIKDRTPPIVDKNGQNLGNAAALIRAGQVLAVPADFVWNQMMQDDEARSNISMPYVDSVVTLKRTILKMKDSSELAKLEAAIQKALVFFATGKAANKKELDKLNKYYDEFAEWSGKNVKQALKYKNKVRQASNDALRHYGRALDKELEHFEKALARLDELNDKLDESNRELKRLGDQLNGLAEKNCKKVIEFVCKIPLVCDRVEKVLCETNPAWSAIVAAIEKEEGLRDQIAKDLQTQSQKTRDALRQGIDLIIEISELESAITDGIIPGLQEYNSLLPLKTALEKWAENIDLSMQEWVVANGEAISRSMTHEDALAPLMHWLDCSLAPILGIPRFVTNVSCIAKDGMASVNEKLDKLLVTLAPRPISDIIGKVTDFKSMVKDAVKKEIMDEMLKLVDKEYREFLQVLMDNVDDQRLNGLFSQDSTNKQLLLIPDAAQRVKAEMNMQGGVFDKRAYAVVFNAIQSARLSLANPAGLNGLSQRLGASAQLYGQDDFGQNILTGALRSIDGNHQWLPLAPPYPRRTLNADQLWAGSEKDPFNLTRRFSLSTAAFGPTAGLRLWNEPQARDRVFERVFKGPLTPGIEAPHENGFPALLPSDYIYRPCTAIPFPELHDQRCVMIPLIPVISTLL